MRKEISWGANLPYLRVHESRVEVREVVQQGKAQLYQV